MVFSYRSGFTLVEAIVVVTIIAILSTVSFVMYTGITLSSRDGVRLENVAQIHSAMQQYRMENAGLPIPDDEDAIRIVSGSLRIAYQGYLSNSLVNVTKMRKGWHDPKDVDYNGNPLPYSYAMNDRRTQLSIFAQLEEAPRGWGGSLVDMKRFSYVFGSKTAMILSAPVDGISRPIHGMYNALESLSGSLDTSASSWTSTTKAGQAISFPASSVVYAKAKFEQVPHSSAEHEKYIAESQK